MFPVFTSFVRRATLLGSLGLLASAAQAQTISSFSPQGGVAGTQITISGLALGNTSAVLLNGQPMPIVTKGTTQVVVKIPAAASSGKILLVSTTAGVSTAVTSTNVLFATRTSAGVNFPQVGTGAVVAASGRTYSTPTFADLNNDGTQELLVGYDDGTIKSFSYSAGAFSAPVSLTYTIGTTTTNTNFTLVGTANGQYAKPTVSDLDGDGLLDLIVGTGLNQTLARYEQTTANSLVFGTQEILQAKSTAAAATYVNIDNNFNFPRPVVTDLDGNGLLDLIVGDDNGQLARFEQVDHGVNAAKFSTLRSTTGYSFLTAGGTTIDVGFTSKPQITDLDGDGKMDMLVGFRAGNVRRFEQTDVYSTTFNDLGLVGSTDTNTAMKVGTGTVANDNSYAAPAIGDIDGDGVEDVAIGSNDGTIMRYEQAIVAPTPLPVVLVSFAGQTNAAGTLLRWTTAQEKNSSAFYVERATDGKTFGSIGEVAAAGNSTSARNYQYQDQAAPAGTAYYRLRQVDFDGTTTYSPIVAVSRAAAAATTAAAFPNPFTEALAVALPAGQPAQAARLQLTTLTGQPVYSATLQLSATPQPLTNLPTLTPGLYVLRLTTAAGTTTQRLTRR